MKKLLLTFLSILFVFAALAQRPEKGNLVAEFQMNLRNNNFFFPVGPGENLILPTLRFRYFLQNDIAVRADVNVAIQNMETEVADMQNGSNKTGSRIQDMNTVGGGIGIEKHLEGNSRFSPFIGLGGSFALGTVSSEYTNFDPVTNRFLDGSNGSTENESTTISGVLFAGADYWIANSFYLGAQIGAQYIATNTKDGVSIENGVKQVNKGGSNRAISFNAIPNIRVGYNFSSGKNGDNQDSDNDGVADAIDKCPNSPTGMKVGSNGCPTVIMDVQLLAKNIYFETASDVLKPESYASLDKVASIMVANPIANLNIEGHTDNQGDERDNLELSKRRAQSVLNYLGKKGADVSHLQATGFGETKPIADNTTKEGRALNRRVELLLSF